MNVSACITATESMQLVLSNHPQCPHTSAPVNVHTVMFNSILGVAVTPHNAWLLAWLALRQL